MIGDNMTKTNNLTIAINSIDESGNYTCFAQNKHGTNFTSLIVTVQGKYCIVLCIRVRSYY